MSDFDKEAEREKLRKRFEEDKQEREATQRMSDLLLKGATMTNRHCNQCRSPIFRQNGEEFCPSCQQAVESETQDAEEDSTHDGAEQTADGESRSAHSESTAEQQVPDTEQEPREDASGNRRAEASPRDVDSAASRVERPREQSTDADQPSTQDAQPRTRTDPTVPTGNTGADYDTGATSLADARSALSDALVTHADLASQTTDPRQAREHLEAACVAADALDTLPSR
jgi:uncharacterized Zn finger protein (UPF0148 family)